MLVSPRDSDPPRGDDAPVTGWALVDRALITFGVLLLLTSTPVLVGDGFVRYEAVQQFAEGRGLSTMKYSLIGPLFSLPLWFVGRVLGEPEFWVARYNLLLFLVALVILWRVLRDHLDAAVVRHFILLLMAASMFPGHLQHFYGEVFTALLVGVGIVGTMVTGGFLPWVSIAVGVANTPAALGGLVLVAIRRTFDRRQLRFLVAVVLALLLIGAETWIRRHELVVSDYSGDRGFETILPYSGLPGFSYPFFFGVLSILLSFGKGIFFFAPGLLLPVRTKLRSVAPAMWSSYVLWLLFLVGLVLVYARWWSWYGGFFWGPRFFLFASIPASFSLAVRANSPSRSLAANAATAAALVLSGWVAINGAVHQQVGLDICHENVYALEHLCWHVPEFSVLWHPFVAAPPLSVHDIAFMSFVAVVIIRMLVPLGPVVYRDLSPAVGRVTDVLRPRLWRF